ncbi:MAG: D-glycero-beta-D-manno-heptose 1-phosphate adenylyltransferase [bacterium]|nr:D-glycero-beta-D-manno-heptose 1-phosphate adenylyltransferase [bacterium]
MNSQNKIYQSYPSFDSRLKEWRQSGLNIIFTNGCFDLLHLGHVDYLERARSLGDKLIVGLNSDSSVKSIKGESRPINDESIRMRMIAALECVDAVVLFQEDTPLILIQNILPSVLVKGKDYDISNIVGADVVIANGGRVETLELVEGYSTTKLIETIQNKKGTE